MVRDLKIFVLENIRYFVTTGNLVTRKKGTNMPHKVCVTYKNKN